MSDGGRAHGDSSADRRSRVLVVGTTPDYVDLLRHEHPDTCLFLTEAQLRRHARESCPGTSEEVLYRDEEQLAVTELVRRHLEHHDIRITGVACFDCESMPLASLIAQQFGLPYPLPETVARCRNKRQMKECWKAGGTPTARFAVVGRSQEAVEFLHQTGGPCVLKPLSGSGSELIFRVETEAECRRLFNQMIALLEVRREAPLFRSCPDGRTSVLIEECVEGQEYSCDFLIESGRVCVIRVAVKHRSGDSPFGIIEAYELSRDLPDACQSSRLTPLLLAAATSLGIDRAICMADFIVRDGQSVFLELTPRCGGDCLPPLLKTACDFDSLGLAIRFARESVDNAVTTVDQPTVALRLFADRAGTLESTDTAALASDRRVVSVTCTRQSGDSVQLPPLDYDSWILGHVIYRPEPGRMISEQNDELKSLFQFRITAK